MMRHIGVAVLCGLVAASLIGCSRAKQPPQQVGVETDKALVGRWELSSISENGQPRSTEPQVFVLEFSAGQKWVERVTRFGTIIWRQEGNCEPATKRGMLRLLSAKEEGTFAAYKAPSFVHYGVQDDVLTIRYYEDLPSGGVNEVVLQFKRVGASAGGQAAAAKA